MTNLQEQNEKYSAVIPIMEGLFKGYHDYPVNIMRPSIIYDDMSYLINFMIISDEKKFIKLLKSDDILNVEVGIYTTEDKKLGLVMVFNKEFQFKCVFNAKDQAERRAIYEAFELSKQLIVWNLDENHHLLRVQKIGFDFNDYLNVLNKYLLQV